MPDEEHIIEVDESVARAMRDEKLDGRMCLMDDLLRGHHARAVVSELEHAKAAKHRGEHSVCGGDLEMRLEAVFHGTGFHTLAQQEGTYEAWDDDDFINWRLKRFEEARVKYTPRKVSLLMPGFAFQRSERLTGCAGADGGKAQAEALMEGTERAEARTTNFS